MPQVLTRLSVRHPRLALHHTRPVCPSSASFCRRRAVEWESGGRHGSPVVDSEVVRLDRMGATCRPTRQRVRVGTGFVVAGEADAVRHGNAGAEFNEFIGEMAGRRG